MDCPDSACCVLCCVIIIIVNLKICRGQEPQTAVFNRTHNNQLTVSQHTHQYQVKQHSHGAILHLLWHVFCHTVPSSTRFNYTAPLMTLEPGYRYTKTWESDADCQSSYNSIDLGDKICRAVQIATVPAGPQVISHLRYAIEGQTCHIRDCGENFKRAGRRTTSPGRSRKTKVVHPNPPMVMVISAASEPSCALSARFTLHHTRLCSCGTQLPHRPVRFVCFTISQYLAMMLTRQNGPSESTACRGRNTST